MNRKFLFIALLLLALMTGNRAVADFAVTVPSGQELWFHILNNGKDVSVSGNYVSGDLVIPFKVIYNGGIYDVTTIGQDAFADCTGLTSVTIPNSVTKIGEDAFYFCTGLTSVTIPNSVTTIGEGAFFGCMGLTSIVVSSGNAYFDSRDNCNAIIHTSSNVLIAGCKNTIIPNSVTKIGEYAFCNCTGLTSVTIPNSVTKIGEYAFCNCTGLTSVTIPNSVTTIGLWAFSGCTGLTSVAIPNSVTMIGEYAFYFCTGLTSVTIPNSVTEIGEYAFCNCTGLQTLTFHATVPPSIGNECFTGVNQYVTVRVPCGSLDDYKSAYGGYFTNITCIDENEGGNGNGDEGGNGNGEEGGNGNGNGNGNEGGNDNPNGITTLSEAGIRIATQGMSIRIDGAEGQTVSLYDMQGRCLMAQRAGNASLRLAVPSAGIYMVRIGDYPAQRLAVLR